MRKIVFACMAIVMVLFTPAQALPTDNRDAALAGADRLLDVQFDDGSFPWIVGESGKFQNIQGLTAYALLDAYRLSLDGTYLGNATTGAEGNRNWLADYMADDPDAFISSSNAFFLADYAMLTQTFEDLELARDALQRALDRFGGATALVEGIVQSRANQGHTNLGLWDAALFVRAAQDVGEEAVAEELADALAAQTIVDPFNASANWYEIGLTGILFGLAEADMAAHLPVLLQARDALLATQCSDGSFSATWDGEAFCGDVQASAYGVIGLSMVLDVLSIQSACDFLRGAQAPNGGWDLDGEEIAEVDSEAVMALSICAAPTNNGATSYADPVRSML